MRYGGFGHGMMGFGHGMIGFGFGWLVMVGMVVLFVLAVLILFRLIKKHGHHLSAHSSSSVLNSSALNILDERYAKGELTDEQYRLMKKEILQR